LTNTISLILRQIHQRVAPVTETPNLDSQVLLAHILGKPRTWIMAHPEAKISEKQQELLDKALTHLENSEPLPYVIGHWEFYGINLKVSPNTLIPRPETELMVEWALRWLNEHPKQRHALDVGTGCGAIAIALATNLSNLNIIASDISFPALQTAQQNIGLHGLHNQVFLIQADLIPATNRHFDLICANLPYIPTEILRNLDVYLREPLISLDGGLEGLDQISRLIEQISHNPRILSPDGLLLLEIDAIQGLSVQSLVKQFLPYADTQIVRDLAGKDRLAAVQMKKYRMNDDTPT
jgi:release factor glutamine methyltransferase